MEAHKVKSKFGTMKPSVEFINICDQYWNKEDLFCKYKLLDHKAQEGDRVAVYQLGWSYVRDYLLFEWAPNALENEEVIIKFNSYDLPKNATDYYQICYISSDNELKGASSPFQFVFDIFDSIDSNSCKNETSEIKKSQPRKLNDFDKDRQIQKLKEENAILKECLKSLMEQKQPLQKKSDDIIELKEITQKLYTAFKFQQNEIDILKKQLNNNLNINDNRENMNTKIIINDYDLGELESIPPFPVTAN